MKLPKNCINCDAKGNNIWLTVNEPIEQIINGNPMHITSEYCKCRKCGFGILADGQFNSLVQTRQLLNS